MANNQGNTKDSIITNLTDGFQQIKQIKAGKLKTRAVEEFLNEI